MLSREEKPRILATYELQAEDEGRTSVRLPECEHCGAQGRRLFLSSALGSVQAVDVGKRVSLVRYPNGAEVVQVENEEQRRLRLARALVGPELASKMKREALLWIGEREAKKQRKGEEQC